MASYQTEREDFIVTMQAEGMPVEISRRLMRWSNTYQRLAVLACNGVRDPQHFLKISDPGLTVTWCGEEIVTPEEITNKIRTTKRWGLVTCPDCLKARTERMIREWCGKAGKKCIAGGVEGFKPIFHGDPRGTCVKISVPSGKTDDHAREGVCVPTRRY